MEDLAEQIPNLTQEFDNLNPSLDSTELQRRKAAVIVVTPKLAHLLKDPQLINATLIGNGFSTVKGSTITRFSKQIAPSMSQTTDKQSMLSQNIDVVCGIVDSMSPTSANIPQAPGSPVREGISIIYGHRSNLLPNFETESENTSAPLNKPGSLIFCNNQHDTTKLTLPLANTLFLNGSFSTLSASQWQYSGLSRGYVKDDNSISMQSCSIAVHDLKASNLSSHAPVIPLTPLRPIVDVYGNILRTIDFGGGNKFGASLELETKVPKFLDAVSQDSKLDIWALLAAPKHVHVGNINDVRRNMTRLIRQGARICRVRKLVLV